MFYGSLWTQEAASAGAKLLCFPESFSFIGAKDGDSLKIAEPLDGPIMKQYQSLARFVYDIVLCVSLLYNCLTISLERLQIEAIDILFIMLLLWLFSNYLQGVQNLALSWRFPRERER